MRFTSAIIPTSGIGGPWQQIPPADPVPSWLTIESQSAVLNGGLVAPGSPLVGSSASEHCASGLPQDLQIQQ